MALRLRSRNWPAAAATGVLVAIALIAAVGPIVYPTDPWSIVGTPNLPPLSDGFVFGTDMMGRDILAGIVHGARVSILIGLASTAAAVVVGCLVGACAGYFAGAVDTILNKLIEFFQAIPNFLLAVVIVVFIRPSLASEIAAIAVVTWPSVARLVRGEVLALRSREFVAAAKMVGVPDAAIIVREILPNCLPTIIVASALMIATAILLESALSFLGLSDPDYYSWGYMIGASRDLIRDAWWMSTIPGVAIFITVLSINLASDGLNEMLNPRAARR